MKRVSIYLFLALLTFAIGISFAALWLFKREIPDVPAPQSQKSRNTNYSIESEIALKSKIFWDKEILGRFNEKPLRDHSDAIDETYRLVLIPTFHAPVSIRLWRKGDEKFLVVKKTSGKGGFGINNFGKQSYEKTLNLTEDEWQTFINFLDESYFWDMPEVVKEELGTDGATWIVEGLKDKMYHQVWRTIPDKEFRESCTYLLRLASLEKEYEGY